MSGGAATIALTPLGGVQFGDFVDALAWRPDGGMVAVACADGTVHELLPDASASAPVGAHEGGTLALAYALDGTLATAGADGRVQIAPLPAQLAGAGWVEHLSWSPDGGLLATAIGRRVQLWTPDGRLAMESELEATVECLAWSPEGARLGAGGHGGVSLLGRDGAVDERLGFAGVVLALAWAPDRRRLACGMQDQAVWLWDVERRQAATMDGYSRKVRELSWSDDGRWLATGGGTVPVVWGYPNGDGALQADAQLELRAHERAVGWCGFQPGGRYLATAAADGLVILWRPPGDRPLTAGTVGEEIGACAWSPDGRRLALGGATGRVAVFELAGAAR